MKITYRWLKEFIDVRLPPETLAHKLTMAGIEVKAVVACGEDSVFEIEITSNRPDWLSIAGIAREVSAITGIALKKRVPQPLSFVKSQYYSECPVSIEDPSGCSVYTACLIEGVKVQPSPGWLKDRLEMVGCRSINNVVDITNYVLFELGEPLHAFDADMLAGPSIIVRRARSSEKLVTIDGQERVLDPGILVIADCKKPVALAGIMGGRESEVSGQTRNILLEAAIFDPLVIRRGRQALGIQSEASYRFERGIDPAILEPAALRAARMIIDLAGGKPVCARRSGTLRYRPRTLSFDLSKNSSILGMDISQRQARTVFTNLGFEVSAQRKGCLNVTVPSHRPDIKEEIDLTEELARITGYDKVPVSLPRLVIQKEAVVKKDPIRFIKSILVGLGLEEVITYSIISRQTLQDLWFPSGEAVRLANPLNKEQDILRPTLIPSLTECVAYNLRQKQESVSIFEIAKTYVREEGQVQERYALAIALCGTRGIWHSKGRLQDAAGLLHLKGITETLLGRLG